jgi:hypothetical protein
MDHLQLQYFLELKMPSSKMVFMELELCQAGPISVMSVSKAPGSLPTG